MRGHTIQLAVGLAVFFLVANAPNSAAQRKTAAPTHRKAAAPAHLTCGDLLSFQVLLDRQGFSPGELDGRTGAKFARALAVAQAANNLPATGQPDCTTWNALGGEASLPLMTTYVVTTEDLQGPFNRLIPRSIVDQESLPRLGYRSAMEMLAERFHMSPALLQQLNRSTPVAAGRRIQVPAVTPFDPDARQPSFDPAAKDAAVTVSRAESSLRVTRPDGGVIFFAPVTTGGQNDPLPIGDWKVTGINWHPIFHYNPDLFWDAKPGDSKATIKPGPNNPVGVVWIDLNLEHYGLHGSPEPGLIGRTESHGCVRLTNWDAARVASMVQPGTPVLFR